MSGIETHSAERIDAMRAKVQAGATPVYELSFEPPILPPEPFDVEAKLETPVNGLTTIRVTVRPKALKADPWDERELAIAAALERLDAAAIRSAPDTRDDRWNAYANDGEGSRDWSSDLQYLLNAVRAMRNDVAELAIDQQEARARLDATGALLRRAADALKAKCASNGAWCGSETCGHCGEDAALIAELRRAAP